MAIFDDEINRLNRQRQGNLDTSQGFQRPNSYRNPRLATGPFRAISGPGSGPTASLGGDLRRVLNGQSPIVTNMRPLVELTGLQRPLGARGGGGRGKKK